MERQMTNNGPERLPLLFWLCGWDYHLHWRKVLP